MSLKTGKKITRRSWDAIPMPDVVIDRVNELGKDQPEQMVFLDRKGRPIGDVEFTGVDRGRNVAPRQPSANPAVEILDDLDNPNQTNEQEAVPEPELHQPDPEGEQDPAVVPEPEQQPAQQPEPVVEPVEDGNVVDNNNVPLQAAPEAPGEIPGVRRSRRVRFHPSSYCSQW